MEGEDADADWKAEIEQSQAASSPQNPIPPEPQQVQESQEAIRKVRNQMNIGMAGRVGAAVLVIVVVLGAFILLNGGQHATTSTTTVVTTVNQAAMQINGCMNITKPGSYYLSSALSVQIKSGACINVKSSNVALIGNLNKLTGSGPFVGIAPFTYGIYIGKYSNVSVNGFTLSSFSYGIYLNQTTNSNIALNNVTKMAISGIALNRSSNNLVLNNTVSSAAGTSGGISLYKGGNNKVIGDVIINNAFYGLVSNSTNNTYQKDVFTKNPTDVYCPFLNSSFRQSNLFGSSTCSTNSYCNFAQCTAVNLPSQISSYALSPPTIGSCGGIKVGGMYALSNDLNMKSYLNTSNPLSSSQSCIRILSPNVNINCNYHRILNAPYGINASGQFNTTIRNCIFINESIAGISANSNFNLKVQNITVSGSKFGLQFTNGTIATVTNTLTTNNTYGVYINATGAFGIGRFNSSKNTYGAYIDGASGISLSSGTLFSNTKSDIYCSATTYNSTQNQFQSTSCGTTDCAWAPSCAVRQKPPIALFPINTCFTIIQSGNYSLKGNIIGADKCINVQASNVNFNCNGYNIAGNLQGSAIFVGSRQSGIAFNNCKINRFQYGVLASNVTQLTIQNSKFGTVSTGISISNSMGVSVISNNVTSASGAAAYTFNGVSNSTVYANVAFATAGTNATNGFAFINSTRNIVSFNNATQNAGYGMAFTGSLGNNVFNNSAYTSGRLDWFCSNSSSGIYASAGGINFGQTKNTCRWLVMINPITVLSQPCLAISSGAIVSLTSDLVYRYGGTCFSIYNLPPQNVANGPIKPGTSANGTVINCNYHTILATRGGTFVNIINSSSVIVQNCYLKNFTTAIRASGYRPIIQNNTVASSANYSIGVFNTAYPIVRGNRVLNATFGFYFSNATQGTVSNNYAINANTGFAFVKGLGYTLSNNTAYNGMVGLSLLNSTIDILQNNVFKNQSTSGIMCTKYSQNSTSLNKDFGGNFCSSNSKCLWMTGASSCAPS